MSSRRVNLVSLLALLFLVALVAITPESRQLMARVALWMEGVEEKIETSRRERESAARPVEESRPAEESLPEVPPPHIVKGEDGALHPEPGYKWVNDDPEHLVVAWVPGTRHPEQAGVIASDEPDQWKTSPGYEWATGGGVNDMSAVWSPGKPHGEHENVVAAEKQEEWTPAPGYKWLNDDPNDLTVIPAEPGTLSQSE
ncbi:MAG TPA: hypothetical protein VFR31_05375 [Thermoanaerobaculia bacterium]|nr:hypothetical protein [Thermoanaerobaculia bacterium]